MATITRPRIYGETENDREFVLDRSRSVGEVSVRKVISAIVYNWLNLPYGSRIHKDPCFTADELREEALRWWPSATERFNKQTKGKTHVQSVDPIKEAYRALLKEHGLWYESPIKNQKKTLPKASLAKKTKTLDENLDALLAEHGEALRVLLDKLIPVFGNGATLGKIRWSVHNHEREKRSRLIKAMETLQSDGIELTKEQADRLTWLKSQI